ncbi:hypothetical protein B0H11DRAFT_2079091 [Mycena galericulata]|nr:hypothetical protein B0H11DRAFT_2079091 [Mycena galericulata]
MRRTPLPPAPARALPPTCLLLLRPPALHETTFNSLFRRDLDIRCNIDSNKLTALLPASMKIRIVAEHKYSVDWQVYSHLAQHVPRLVVLQAGYDHIEYLRIFVAND